MKYLGVGGSRADVMMTVSALPGAEGILQERNPWSSITWACISVRQRWDSVLLANELSNVKIFVYFYFSKEMFWLSSYSFNRVC